MGMEQGMVNKNYLIGVNLLNNGFYGKAIGYFKIQFIVPDTNGR